MVWILCWLVVDECQGENADECADGTEQDVAVFGRVGLGGLEVAADAMAECDDAATEALAEMVQCVRHENVAGEGEEGQGEGGLADARLI